VRILQLRLLCANRQLFRDGTPCEDCVGSHPWHGVQHGCHRGSRLLTVPPAGTIALHRRLGTGERCATLVLALKKFARVRFVRGGLPADQIQVKANFVPDPGPRSGSASSSRTLLPVLTSNTGRMSDLVEPLGLVWLVPPGAAEAWAAALSRLGELGWVEAGGRQARAHYEKSFTEASAAAALDDAYQAARDQVMGSGTA
jgi:hypothetical protein